MRGGLAEKAMPENLLADILAIARESGDIVRGNWNRPHTVRHKGAIDLVTETDLAVQKYLRESLADLLPGAGFIGEENDGGKSADLRELCWIVDPVDGTTNFVHRIPFVGISIALCQNGNPLLGIVNAPILGECFHAVKGHGAFLNNSPIHVSEVENPGDCLAATGFPYNVQPVLADLLDVLRRVLPATQGLRRAGAASIDLAYVACGRLDAYFEADLKPWDMAAGWLLVTEAGGIVSGYDGSSMAPGMPLLADNGHVHEAMLKLLAPHND